MKLSCGRRNPTTDACSGDENVEWDEWI